MHCPLLQQPLGQDGWLQTQPAERHCCPLEHAPVELHRHSPVDEQLLATCAGQGKQLLPGLPQLSTESCWQAPAELQQPLEQELRLQKQAPRMHSWPGEQGGPIPQPQPPSTPQESVVVVAQDRQLVPSRPQ